MRPGITLFLIVHRRVEPQTFKHWPSTVIAAAPVLASPASSTGLALENISPVDALVLFELHSDSLIPVWSCEALDTHRIGVSQLCL